MEASKESTNESYAKQVTVTVTGSLMRCIGVILITRRHVGGILCVNIN